MSASPLNASHQDQEKVIDIVRDVVESFSTKEQSMSEEQWIEDELRKHLPEMSYAEAEKYKIEIIQSVEVHDANLKSLSNAVEQGTTKEKWLQIKVQEATIGMEVSKVGQYLQEIDHVIATSNQQMRDAITNLDGSINMNSNLDGFIFEHHHANTFNMEAALRKSNLRAEVLSPKPGETYTKNSVDLVIKDEFGTIVKKYQAKLSGDAVATNRAFDKGNYAFQGKLISKGQALDVSNGRESIGNDNLKSRPMDKAEGKQLQKLAQEGQSLDTDWNYYKLKDLTSHMTKNIALAGFQSATVAVGFDLVHKKMTNQEIKGHEVVKAALRTGADAGVKSATAVALKIASEKGLIAMIPKGTPAGVIANVACVSIENVKVLGKVANGELTIVQGLEKMERVTVSAVSGLICSGLGAAEGAIVGAMALSWIPVVGTVAGAVLGSMVGGTVAYMAGSTIGETICKAGQKVRSTAVNMIKSGAKAVGKAYNTAKNFIKSLF
ncbi:hypothetical protein [Paenibacillus sp. 2TAB19]|uniref:hypothetical protein n=1 Tax=Paenibacillus sp. 2TAB19 TaxID=3233003 RepID=UPI003F9A6CA5